MARISLVNFDFTCSAGLDEPWSFLDDCGLRLPLSHSDNPPFRAGTDGVPVSRVDVRPVFLYQCKQ